MSDTDNPYRGITPEELHIAMRRAHLERAQAVRGLFAAALAWAREALGHRQAIAGHPAACHAAAKH